MAIGIIVKPAGHGPAETLFVEGLPDLEPEADTTPRIEVKCCDNGDITLRRCGLEGLTSAATIALAITRIGFDITIEERITPVDGFGIPITSTTFTLKGFARERYHLTYNSSAFSTFLATSFPNHPGIEFSRTFPT